MVEDSDPLTFIRLASISARHRGKPSEGWGVSAVIQPRSVVTRQTANLSKKPKHDVNRFLRLRLQHEMRGLDAHE